jgi:predicted RNA-binding protein YlxR (DUF448 family)
VETKRTMIRIVRTPDGVQIDPNGKIPGRGAYLHEVRSCWESGLKGPLTRALKIDLSPEDRERLFEYMSSLPDDASIQIQDAK